MRNLFKLVSYILCMFLLLTTGICYGDGNMLRASRLFNAARESIYLRRSTEAEKNSALRKLVMCFLLMDDSIKRTREGCENRASCKRLKYRSLVLLGWHCIPCLTDDELTHPIIHLKRKLRISIPLIDKYSDEYVGGFILLCLGKSANQDFVKKYFDIDQMNEKQVITLCQRSSFLWKKYFPAIRNALGIAT